MRIFTACLLTGLLAACAVNKSTKTLHDFTGSSIGCGNFIVYKLTKSNDEFISIKIDVSAIELEKMQAYGVGKTDFVNVVRRKYAGAVNSTLCNDVMTPKPELLLEEIGNSGIVELRISDTELEKANNNDGYHATLILKNIVFETQVIDYLQIENVYVGWLPG